jgi:hypothetical protein
MGALQTDSAIVENGTWVTSFVTPGGSVFAANANVSTVIIDSLNSAAITSGTVKLPSNPVNGQKFRISAVAPITTANIYSNGSAVKWLAPSSVATTAFSAGNIIVQLTYSTTNATWYRS